MKINFEKVFSIDSVEDEDDIIKSIDTSEIYFVTIKKDVAKYELKKDDVLFITKGCTIPRFKMKAFCETNKVKLTRDSSKATAIIVNPENFLAQYTDRRWTYSLSKEAYLNHFSKMILPNTIVSGLLDNISKSDADKISFNYWQMRKLDENLRTIDLESRTMDITNEEQKTTLENILTRPVYSQDDILKIINGNAVVMTTEMYHEASKLFESSDNSNLKVAMEIISNCDYQQSAVYILLLFKNYGSKMWDSGSRNHVNFKSLCNYFELNDRYSMTRLDIDNIVTMLKKKEILTQANIDILHPIASEEINDASPFNYFKTESIVFVPPVDEVDEDEEDTDDEELDIDDDGF